MSEFTGYFRAAIPAVLDAGREILSVYASADFEIAVKEDRSPLTLADRKAHQAIMKFLSSTGLPVLSEEGASIPYIERKSWKRYWLVDPLDGTKEFIRRNGDFTVNIALIENLQPVMGIIYVPVTDTLYFGSSETGSGMLNNAAGKLKGENAAEKLFEAASRLPIYEDDETYTIVASRSHLSPETEAFIRIKTKDHKNINLVSRGSSLKICMVADGTANVYPRLAPTMEWDVAAGHAIAAFAGCTVTDYESGKPLQYNKENLLNPYFIVNRE